ncbi:MULTISPECIES: hypothetical protein [Alphaproteobacteria]|mgnify:CR=1|uniref:hypothetical protein n=1 Tax=Alphaproteobacteria TaxID=28211 RepID=UPI000DE167C5|nr:MULTISPECIES: hypothetical protein [Alphaproteobacteria]MBN7756481.1 hypothetical protein [Nitratireductor aquimarinus]MBY5999240.1 hypothetical protein [Tritonibacter mobilis]MBY6021267.1 hypothetical protein [Nitratireductor sp. DP7N14-4]
MGEQYGRRRTETLDYVQAMLGQLRTMALSERCDMLAYLIEMAYLEASDIIRGERPHRVGQGRGVGECRLELDVGGNKRDRAS